MRTESLEDRARARNTPVPLRVTVTRETLLLVEGLAKQHEITVEQAVSQAISDWRVRWEASANRKTRLTLERRLREAKDRRSVDLVIADFKVQMHAAAGGEHKDSPEGLHEPDKPVTVRSMSEGKPVRIAADIPASVAAELEAIAKREDRSIAWIIRRAVSREIELDNAAPVA